MAKKLSFLLILAGLLGLGSTASAQRYLMNFTATYKSTNSAGALVTGKLSSASMLTEIFADGPIGRMHQLVFDFETGELLVIQKGTGEVLGTWYQFTLDTSVANAGETKSENYWTLSCPADDGYQGTAVGTVQVVRDSENQITKARIQGKFTLRFQADGYPTRVFSGVFATGARYLAP